ncbi:MAG: hypothetical protein R3E10_13925 [Gemmatimonadota bacterium]
MSKVLASSNPEQRRFEARHPPAQRTPWSAELPRPFDPSAFIVKVNLWLSL